MTFRQIAYLAFGRNGEVPAECGCGTAIAVGERRSCWLWQVCLMVVLNLAVAGCGMFRGGPPSPAAPPADGIDALLGGLLPPLPDAIPPDAPSAPATPPATPDEGGDALPAVETLPAEAPVPNPADASVGAPELDPAETPSDAVPVMGPDGEPQLRVGLTLRVSVMVGDKAEVPEVTRQITGKGEIDLPFVGRVPCAGLTLPQLKTKLVKLYGDFLRDPEVTAEFAYGADGESPWGKVRVMGHVGSEGWINIPPTRDLTVLRALQLSGGVRPGAKRSSVRVTRNFPDGSKKTFRVDLDEMGRKGDTEQDIPLLPGDVVWVEQSKW